jgi:hypothetical protein
MAQWSDERREAGGGPRCASVGLAGCGGHSLPILCPFSLLRPSNLPSPRRRMRPAVPSGRVGETMWVVCTVLSPLPPAQKFCATAAMLLARASPSPPPVGGAASDQKGLPNPLTGTCSSAYGACGSSTDAATASALDARFSSSSRKMRATPALSRRRARTKSFWGAGSGRPKGGYRARGSIGAHTLRLNTVAYVPGTAPASPPPSPPPPPPTDPPTPPPHPPPPPSRIHIQLCAW